MDISVSEALDLSFLELFEQNAARNSSQHLAITNCGQRNLNQDALRLLKVTVDRDQDPQRDPKVAVVRKQWLQRHLKVPVVRKQCLLLRSGERIRLMFLIHQHETIWGIIRKSSYT